MKDYERIKELRKYLKLSQTDFATKIGVTRGVIANIEAGLVEIKEYVLKLICSVFGASEEWILTGNGEMFVKSKQTILDELAAAHGLSKIETAIIGGFLDLSPDGRAAVAEYIQNIINRADAPTAPTREEMIKGDIAATEKKLQEATEKQNVK